MRHALVAFAAALVLLVSAPAAFATRTMLVPQLDVRTAATGLVTPTTMAFLSTDSALVLEKNTGKVQYLTRSGDTWSIDHTALDLAVNNSSERGLLGIAFDPAFAINHLVYLYWTCTAPPPPPDNPFVPSLLACADTPALGADTGDILAVPLLGNRVDRFVWNGASLTFDRNLIKLHAFQNDGAPTPPGQGDESQPPRGNHNAGVIRFGPDGKLYVIIGDNGRRGQLQNLPSGPTETGLGTAVPDDQFGGPQPDNAHFTGVVLRLNTDGTAPTDNPFFAAGAAIAGEVGSNLQKTFAYGVRNSFGLAFDPISGRLWESENGDTAFDELNQITAGHNGGWIQFMGPASRIAQFKAIETTPGAFFGLQQLRWPPTRLADTPAEALSRLFDVPGSHYADPQFSWKFALAPAGIGFSSSRQLGPQFLGDLFVGFATPSPLGGPLFHFNLTGNRRKLALEDPRLSDLVADNSDLRDMTESESLLVGRDFGIVTDIETGPNGNLFVVSLSDGAIYEVHRR